MNFLAAIVVPLFFTAPAPQADKYEAVWAENGTAHGKNLWNGPRGFADGPAVPNAPGSPDTAWIVLSTAAPLDGVAYVYGVRGAALGPISNPARRRWPNPRPDTLMAVARLDTTFIEWARVLPGGVLAYRHAVGDTLPVIFVTQGAIQWKYHDRICELFGLWAEGGRLWPCGEEP